MIKYLFFIAMLAFMVSSQQWNWDDDDFSNRFEKRGQGYSNPHSYQPQGFGNRQTQRFSKFNEYSEPTQYGKKETRGFGGSTFSKSVEQFTVPGGANRFQDYSPKDDLAQYNSPKGFNGDSVDFSGLPDFSGSDSDVRKRFGIPSDAEMEEMKKQEEARKKKEEEEKKAKVSQTPKTI
jgi:hypothetical protein